jgi:hypothetical protein
MLVQERMLIIGFRDDKIYEYLKGNNELLDMKQIDRDKCINIMNTYDKELY